MKKFLNIEIEEAPPELKLSVEMRCRDIMKVRIMRISKGIALT